MNDERLKPPAIPEPVLRRYLLGDLTAPERRMLEERYFVDDETFDHLEGVEDSLTDEYVRDELTPAERRLFERFVLKTPRDREKVAFSRALAERRAEVPRARRAGAMPYPLLVAAVLTLVVGGGLWWSSSSLRHGREQPGQESDPRVGERPDLATTVLFDLRIAVTRDDRAIPRLALPPGTETVRLRIDLGEETGYAGYRAAVQTLSGEVVWSNDDLSTRSTEGGTVVDAELPADRLEISKYVLVMTGIAQDGESETIGYREFVIVRP